MADPLNPETELDLASLPEGDRRALDSLFAPAGLTPEQEINSLFSAPSVNLAQAQNLIQTRDDPRSVDLVGGLASRLKEGKLPFNTQSWEDAKKKVYDYSLEISPQMMEAEKNGDWLELTKLSLGGVGKTIGAYLQSGLGVTDEEAKITQNSFAARNYIGTIKDPEQAAKALDLGAIYADELASGKSIVPTGQKPGMAFGTGPLTVKLGMNLAMSENYLRDLESDRSKKLGTASLRNFAIQSGDAFMPFVSIGDIVVDENNPDEVARRAALTNSINDTIQKDYMTGTLAGAAIGSVGSFIGVGGIATKALGRAAQIGDRSLKVPTVFSRGATYATIGASQSFEGDPRNLSIPQRLSSIFSESAILGLAEGAGNKLENSIDVAMANHVAAKALATNIPALAPLVGSTGKIVGTTLGETTSEEIEAILRGQDPVEPLLQNLAVSGGIGVGMAIPGMSSAGAIALRRAKIYSLADERFSVSLEQTLKGIKTDPNLNDQQKAEEIAKLRGSLVAPKAQNLFDALNVRASVDRATAPETAKVADEAVKQATPGSVEAMLSAEISKAEGQIGVPPTIKTEAPESEEEQLAAFAELEKVFEAGAEKVELDNTPSNASKIQWLESQGRIVGGLSEDGKTYSVTNVKTDAGNWLRGTPAIEFEQDLKDQFIRRAEEIGVETDERDQMESEFEKAGTMEELEEVARKYLGPTDYEIALENKLASSQELIEEEKPAEINAQKLQEQINVLESKIKEAPVEEKPAMQEALTKLQALQVEGQAARLVRGEESVSKLVQQFERDVVSDIKAGKLAPELEASPNVVLPQNDPESKFFKRYKKLQPDPRENSKDALGSVFNLSNPATVELLQSLGAIDENGRNMMTPAETLMAYVNRKKSYLQSKSLGGYQKYNISDEVSAATVNSFLYELRQGKNNLSLSTIFNSRLRNFIEKAIPRMRAGVGQGAAISLETPGLRVNAVDAETLAEEQGINPAVAGAINETLDQIDATEVDNQAANPSAVPSQAQRQEALSVLAQNLVTPFRNSLPTEVEKLAFDSLTSGKAVSAADAVKLNTTVGDVEVIKGAVKQKFIAALEADYRKNQQAGTLPAREVAEPEGVVKAGALTYQQIKPLEDRFKSLVADDYFDDAELADAKALLDQVRSSRSAQMLRAFENNIEGVATEKISPEGITALAESIDNNIRVSLEKGKISQKQADNFIEKLNKLAEPYLASQIMEEGDAKNKIAAVFRANLLKVSDQVLADSGVTIDEKGTNEEPTTGKPEAKTTDDRRKEASEKSAAKEAERAAAAKRVPKETVPLKREEVGRAAPDETAGVGRPGVTRPRGTPLPKSYVESRNQLGRPYNEKVLSPIGTEALALLSPEQKQDTAAAITTIESSKHKAFYLANGPGTGKTRVLLAAGKYYLSRGYNVFLLTAPDAVTPNWDLGTIGGSIEKDAKAMGVPIIARGGKGDSGRGLPIEKIPGSIVVSTYTSGYLEEILPLVDAKTVVIFDEQHSGRNLHKAIQEGKSRAWSILMNEISLKAGRVLMASGTPFETPDQLMSLGRLGIFDTESPDALIRRLGFEKQYLRGGKKSYWTLAPGVSEAEMQDRLEEYLDGLVKNGILRSRSLKLDGVNVEFQNVPLDEAIKRQLEDIKNMYGGTQNTDPGALRKLVAAQKRALEEYKVDAAAKRAIKSIRAGRKPIIYVGFVSDTNARGETVDPTSAAVEAAILRLAPDLKIARMYTGSGQTKEQALAAFNSEGADVLIASKEMGGTGIELDDKFGDEPRDMIIMSPPVSAIQAVQLVYRVWRADSASKPNLIFLESEAEVDQQNIDRMRAKLRLLDATTGAGFEGLKAEEVKPTENVAPVRAEDTTTPEQIAGAEANLKAVLGAAYNNGVMTLRDAKNEAKTYSIKFDSKYENALAALPGVDNESDTILINPEKLEKAKRDLLTPDKFNSWLASAMVEETIHVETFRYFREIGLDPIEEITAIGEGLSQAARLAIARLYFSNLGSDITNPEVQGKIKALANNPYLAAMEGIRQIAQLNLAGQISEQVSSIDSADVARATQRLKDVIVTEPKSVLARLGIWFDGMATVVKRGLGLAPSPKQRLLMRQSIADAITNLRKTSKTFVDASSPGPVAASEPGRSPTSPRPSNIFDSYDLRVYRMIENYLEGRTDGVLGVTAADDLFKSVSVEDWLDALDINARRGALTQDERHLFREAAKAVMYNGRASLPAIANKALEIAEGMEEAGRSLPVAAFVSTSAPAEVVNAAQPFSQEGTFREYSVKIPGLDTAGTRARSAAKATSNVVSRIFQNQEVVYYNGARYTSPGPLIAALRDAGYEKFAKPVTPDPTPALPPITLSLSPTGNVVSIPVAATAPAPISKNNLLERERNGELAYHGTNLNQIASLLQGVKPETNFSPAFNGQAFGSEVVLVYPKNQLSLEKKTYQDDLVLKGASLSQPVAAMLDAANFEGSDARRSYSDVMEDIANLPKEDSDIAMDLYAAIDLGDRKKAAQIRDDIRGNPAAVEQQIRDMRIKEFKGKYYLPSGEQIFSLPKAQPKPNAEIINRLAVELSKAPDEATPAVSQEQALNNAAATIPNNLPVFAYELSEDGKVTNIVQVRSAAPQPVAAPEVRESQAVKSLATKLIDALPESAIKNLVSNTWYYSTPRAQQFEDAREYIRNQGNQQKVINQFLGGTVKGALPLQGAVGFELVKILGPKAKTDLFAKQQLVDVMLVLAKKYGTEPGQTVDLWNALNELSDNPEAMKMFINRQIDTAIKGRLTGYREEEEEISIGLKEAARRATESLAINPGAKGTIEKIQKLIELNKKQATVTELEAALQEYVDSDQASADAVEFLGPDLAAAPEPGGTDAENIRLDPERTKILGRMILEIIQRSENPAVTAASEDQIKSLLLLTKTFRDAKNPETVRQKIDLYFDAALANALEVYSAQVLGEARAREGIEPARTRGEAIRKVEQAKAKVKQAAPVAIEQGVGDGSIDHALLDAAADSLQKQAERLQKEPKLKGPVELLVARVKSYIAANTKAEGGLQPSFQPIPKPTEAEVFKDLIAKYPTVVEAFEGIRESLKDNYTAEELVGLEPFIEEVFNNPFTQSGLKKTIRTLESIGGPKTNIQGLIRSSKGDIMTFENELGALLTQNTTLDAAQKKQVLDFLREKLTGLIAEERKLELQRIKKRFEAKKEKKTRKMRSSLDKLIEAANLGVLNDAEVFSQMHSQLGLPELKQAEREHLNELIEALPLYPEGMIRGKRVSEMYQYVKLVSPQVWGELLVNYQTSNLLAAIGTIGINAWSAYVSNELNGAILASVGVARGLAGDKARAKAYIDAAVALNAAIFAGEKPALTAAQNVFVNGDYSNVKDALTMELGGVNIWEAIVKQAEDYRAGKPGTAKPELPVKVFGEEYRIPLDSKYLSSKYGALAPFIFFGRAMAAGDAINRISSRKMYEIAEATNIAIDKGLKTNDEIETEVARLLNQSPEARRRAEAKAASEAKEFDLTPEQQSLRVEEILEQGRPNEEEVKNLIEKSKEFAAKTTYTNDFEGWFGLLADALTQLGAKAWPLRLFIKFLRTGSSLANEILNFMPGISTVRLYRGSAAILKDTKYYRPPTVPGTVAHDLLLGKMFMGYIATGIFLYGLKEAMGGEDDPYFNMHFKGPTDSAQREAFFAGQGKLRSMQFGRFRDGKPIFVSFESFPVGLSGPLLLSAAIAETVRYEKRSKAESIILGGLTGAALAMYGVMDIAALSGIRQIMSLTSPGVGQRDAKGIITNLTKTVGNVAGGLVPGYATLRDVEQLFNGIMGAPSARPYQENLLSTFAQSIPFASKVGRPDLDFLGGNNKTQLANTVPFLRRLVTSGVDSAAYDGGDRSPQAVHDKLISLFAANRSSLDWGAGPLKDFAMMELMDQKQKNGEPVSVDDFYQLKRELSTDEQYEWIQRAGPVIQEQLGALIPQLEKMSRVEFMTVVPQIVNPIKRALLYQLLLEKNQEGILYPERGTVD
jgi:hypothetical protein